VNVGFSLLTLFPGQVGGSESNVRGLLEQFANGNGPAMVTVLANRHVMHAYADLDRGAVSLHEVGSYRPGRSVPTRVLAMAAARARPARAARDVPGGLDLVHFPVTVPIPRTSLPRVTTVYDLQHHDLPEFFSPFERAYRRWAYDGAAREANLVVTTSEWSKERLVALLGLPPGRVEVAYMGVDTHRFTPRPSELDERLRAELELPERFVVYPANLWPHKNHARLVEALAGVADRELGLVLTGSAYGRLPQLTAHAASHGVGDRVLHLGYVEPEVLPALYRQAEAMVFPSLYEGFGAPPLEAMACGCPVASSTRGSLREVCADAALALEPESTEAIVDAIERLLGDAELRARLAATGPQHAHRFSWETTAKRHTAIYERAAATSPSAARSIPQ
jgi:glycosyltransferase involved in cell wall biosynthesis